MTQAQQASADRIPFFKLASYSSLQLPLAMAALPVMLHLSHYYGAVLKLGLASIGTVLVLSRLIDAVQDPFLGYLSDRATKYPHGRLWMVGFALPLMIAGFFMLFDPPAMFHPGGAGYIEHEWLLAGWMLLALVLVHLGYAGASISYHAHGAELTNDYHERTRVTIGREIFGLTGMTLAVVLPTLLVARFGEATGYQIFGLVFIPVAILFALPSLFNSPPSVQPPVPKIQRKSLIHQFLAPLQNTLYRRLLSVYVVNGSALGIAVSVMLFYVEHVMKGTKTEAGVILLCYFIAGAFSVPLWLWLSKRLSKGSAWMIGMLISAAAMAVAGSFDHSELTLFIVFCAIAGMGLGADYGLPPAVLADIIYAKESRTSQGETGAYFGLWALATKVATAVGAALSLPIAAWMGFDPGNNQFDLTGLWFVYIILPVVVKLIAAYMLWAIKIEPERGRVRDVMLKNH
jgi:glycoside/pentoside/hexuronide:cation symporter, GPH family